MSRFWNIIFYSQKLKSLFTNTKIDELDSSHDLLSRMFDLGSEDNRVDLVESDYWIVTKNHSDHWICGNDQDARLLSSLLERENPEHRWGVRKKHSLIGKGDDHIEDASELVCNIPINIEDEAAAS